MDKLSILNGRYGIAVTALKDLYKDLGSFRLTMLTPALYGSGVSELAATLDGYFRELGVECSWRKIEAGHDFFVLSKKISDALCLSMNCVSKAELERFAEAASCLEVPSDCDILYMHDFHALIAASKIKGIKKVYRCHFDISRANKEVWDFLKPYIECCDAVIFPSAQSHRRLNREADYILPSIDPCSVKNTFVEREESLKVLKGYDIPLGKPIILQVSRFDRVKDPFGLIDVFKEVSSEIPSTLVYAGGFAPDDVNAAVLYEELKLYAGNRKDIILLSINRRDYEIAALQSAADVVVQKSFSESFGLSITEALWKKKPVAASDVGGIRCQIINNKTGLLCGDKAGFIFNVKRLLMDKALSLRLATNGHEYVKEHFLITRELKNHAEVFKKIV